MKKTIVALIAMSALTGTAMASYPEQPIRLIIPFAKGGSTDIIARTIAKPLSDELGQPFILENSSGESGIIGAIDLSKSDPDGYTIGISTVSNMASNPSFNKHIEYNPISDFTHIGNIAITPNVLAVSSKLNIENYAQFKEDLSKSRKAYTYGSSGNGSMHNLIVESFKTSTKNTMSHIPFRGSAPALKSAVDNKTNFILDNYPSIKPYIEDGTLQPILVASPSRIAGLPNTPTFKEVGANEANRVAFYGISGPAGMPKDIVNKINTALNTVLTKPEVKAELEKHGAFVQTTTPDGFTNQIKDELKTYQNIIKNIPNVPR